MSTFAKVFITTAVLSSVAGMAVAYFNRYEPTPNQLYSVKLTGGSIITVASANLETLEAFLAKEGLTFKAIQHIGIADADVEVDTIIR